MSRLSDSPEAEIPRAVAATAVLVEDEAPLREELIEMLAQCWPALAIAGCAADGGQALELVARERPDIVFLDIRIPGPDGLAVAGRVSEQSHVVFVTAHDEHAIDAFERGAVDYLLKPLTRERLELTVRRLQQRLVGPLPSPALAAGSLEPEGDRAPRRPLRWITAPVGPSTRFIAVDDIVYFQADHKYTRIVLAGAEFLVRRTLKELLEDLDPDQFWRIHRSTVVNVQEIDAMEPDFAGRTCMRLRSRRELLPVSDSFAGRFRRL